MLSIYRYIKKFYVYFKIGIEMFCHTKYTNGKNAAWNLRKACALNAIVI